MNNTKDEYYPIGKKFFHLWRVMKKCVDHRLADRNLHHGQARILMMLFHHDGLSHSDIAKRMFISPAAATKAIQRLERNGFAIRRPDEEDERVSRVFLLPKGKDQVSDIITTFDEITDQTFDGFTREEKELLNSFIDRIFQNLRETEKRKEKQS